MAWTAEEIETLKQLMREGEKTFQQMMFDLPGKTRNAIIGKAQRLGVPKKREPSNPASKRAPVAIQDKGGTAGTVVETAPLRHALPGEHVVTKFQCEDTPPPQDGVLFTDLKAQHCRWPLNDGDPFRFCGCAKLPGLSYCADHHAAAHKHHPTGKKWIRPKISAFKFRTRG